VKACSYLIVLSELAVFLGHSGHGAAFAQHVEAIQSTQDNQLRSEAPAPGQTRSLDLGGGVTLDVIWVPAGTFMMGSTFSPQDLAAAYGGEPEHFAHELPQREVTVSKGFWMGRYEVTNAQYRRFQPDHSSRDFAGHNLDGDSQPVVFVSWREAQAFCNWLSELTGEQFTLPTEAQWEYACRAGTDTVRYWGNDDESMGHFANVADRMAKAEWPNWAAVETTDGYKVTAPVGSFRPNGFGLFDMLGNVHEWCVDYYDSAYYKRGPSTDPHNTAVTTSRVCRGGGWESSAAECRAASRSGDDPDDHYGSVGFRVATR